MSRTKKALSHQTENYSDPVIFCQPAMWTSDSVYRRWLDGGAICRMLRGGSALLGTDFFAHDTVSVARGLIGAVLAVGDCKGRIVETEAYTTDAASHAVMRQKQAALMRDTFGHVYVYLIYGMYYCLNFTTERGGVGAVLIRAAEPTAGIEEMIARRGATDLKKLASGPGRLCQAFGIDARLNGTPIGREIKLFGRDRVPQISSSPRVGITRATELEWRFYEAGNPFVSRLP